MLTHSPTHGDALPTSTSRYVVVETPHSVPSDVCASRVDHGDKIPACGGDHYSGGEGEEGGRYY